MPSCIQMVSLADALGVSGRYILGHAEPFPYATERLSVAEREIVADYRKAMSGGKITA